MICLASRMKKEYHKWQQIQDSFAEKNSVAVVLVDEQGRVLHASNNNSLCELLLQSKQSAKCTEFCGKVNQMQGFCHVKCYANLNFYTFPLHAGNRNLRLILGRTFQKTEDYCSTTQKLVEGEWHEIFSDKAFENIHFSSSKDELERIAGRFLELVEKESSIADFIGVELRESDEEKGLVEQIKFLESRVDFYYWRRVFNSLLDTDYKEACNWILQFLSERFRFKDLAIFEVQEHSLRRITDFGDGKRFQIQLFAEDQGFYEALSRGKVLEIKTEKAFLFPIIVGSRIRHAILVKETFLSEEIKSRIIKFCREISLQLEILRLRYQLGRQTSLAEVIKNFNRALRKSKHIDLWKSFLQFCSETMQSERCSLLFYDENMKKFYVKSACGRHAEIIKNEENLGSRIAFRVLREGRPIIASSLSAIGASPAPAEWNYRTESFISFPVIVGNRKVGVLNITERRSGEEYDEFDLEILKLMVSQISLAVERATFMSKADEYEQLSITDDLTQLNNRRYLEARLREEVKRCERTGAPLAFLMMDVDDFKHYNDTFGHTEGDKVLKILARVLRETLRGSDIAARYGGEEFSILLPQTTLREAQAIAERIRRRIEKTHFPNRRVTVSIGIAVCKSNCEITQLISSADRALYEAKRKGKNRVEIFLGDEWK